VSEENKALVRRVIEEGWNQHNLALLEELYADCMWCTPAAAELKGEAVKQYVASVLTACPDIRFTVQDLVAEGDKVVLRYSATGTQQGEFMGLAPTGKQFTSSGMNISRIVEGKIVELREQWDALGFLQQLGALPQATEANKALFRRVMEEGWNQHNLASLHEVFADCVYYSPATGELKGEALKQLVASLAAAFPDRRVTIEDQVAEGDKLVTRWDSTGTHQGEFMGLAPTGRQVTFGGMNISRIVEGKVVEAREEWDTLGVFQQLGAVPPTAANMALVRHVFEEGFNKGSLAPFDEHYADCVYHAPAVGELRGEAYRQFLTALLAAFPDGRWTIQDQVAGGDKVVTRWTFTGTHHGELMGLAPTGKQVTGSGIVISRIAGGKVVEEWEEWDTLGLVQQMSALPEATEANKAVLRRAVEEGWNLHNLALLEELYADCVFYRPDTGELKGEALKQFLASMLAAFPDIRFTIEDQVAEGDKLVGRWSCTGTHQGESMGLAPTGKQFTTSGMTSSRIVDGKVVEERVEFDALGFLQQLGVVPPVAKAEDKAAA
jgi:steroid delta-isomerase-like uncharacterized protein